MEETLEALVSRAVDSTSSKKSCPSKRAAACVFAPAVESTSRRKSIVFSREVDSTPRATTIRFHGSAFAELERRARKQNRTVTSFVRNLVLEALQQ